MNRTLHKPLGWLCGGLCLLHFLLFLFWYEAADQALQSGSAGITVWEYISRFLLDLCTVAVPTLALAVALWVGERRVWQGALYGGAILATRLFLQIPYRYVLYVSAGGYDTPEALGVGALLSLAEVAGFFLAELLLFWLLRRLTRSLPCENIAGAADFFRLGGRLCRGVFLSALAFFLVALAWEIADTVSYLISYAGSYRVGEIFYMLARYIFLLFSFFFSHAAAMTALLCLTKREDNAKRAQTP